MTDEQIPSTEEQLQPQHTRKTRPSRFAVMAWFGMVGLALVVGLAFAQLRRSGAEPGSLAKAYGFSIGTFGARAEAVSKPAPDLLGEDLDGKALALSTYRGKVVVLNLWASWCGPCRREEPELQRLWTEYGARRVQVLGMNIRDSRINAKAFRDEFAVTYPSFYDPSAELTFHLGAQVLPTTFIIDPGGKIVYRFTGRIDGILLRDAIDPMLQQEGR